MATSIRTLTHALREKGHTVYIFTPSDPRCEGQPEDEDIFRLPSIPVYFVRDYRAGYIFPPHILKKIKKLNLDIVHTQTEFPLGFLGKLVSTTEGIPMVHTYHTMYEDYVHYIGGGHIISKNMAREFSCAFCNTAMAVIAPTHKTEQLLSGYGVTKPISIIPTGINTAHFRKENFDAAEILALRESLGLKADTPVIISIGRIAKEKSIDVVISALPKLIEKLPEVQMVIVGEGNEIENLRNFAESLGVGAHVMFTGGKPWDEIGKYYQLGNVFCSASVSETQGLTFAEAMAGGIPVVAKKDECIENIITDGETGMLFEKNENLPELLYRVRLTNPFPKSFPQPLYRRWMFFRAELCRQRGAAVPKYSGAGGTSQAHRRPCYSVCDWRKGRQGHYRAAWEDFPYLFKESSEFSFFCQGRIKRPDKKP